MREIQVDEQGRYTNIRYLGGGGTSIVYEAYDTRLQTKVVIKAIREEEVARQEAMILQSLDNRRIPYLIDCYTYRNTTVLVMQYREGITLAQYIELHGTCREKMIYSYLLELTQILHYLHTQTIPILYLDLKPDNIIIEPNGALCLIDFGAARFQYHNNQMNQIYGTVEYAPKELVDAKNGEDELDARADIYSLGMIGLYMSSGVLADDAANIINKKYLGQHFITRRMERIIQKCIREERTRRYNNVKEVATDLRKSKFSNRIGVIGRRIVDGAYSVLFVGVAYYIAMTIGDMNLAALGEYQVEIAKAILACSFLGIFHQIFMQRWEEGKPYQTITHMVLTGRKGGILSILLVVFLLLSIPFASYGKEEQMERKQLVEIQDSYMRSILIREEAVYRTTDDIIIRKIENNPTTTYHISYDGSGWIELESSSFKIDATQLKEYGDVLTILVRTYNQTMYEYAEQHILVAYGE